MNHSGGIEGAKGEPFHASQESDVPDDYTIPFITNFLLKVPVNGALLCDAFIGRVRFDDHWMGMRDAASPGFHQSQCGVFVVDGRTGPC
ncbi:hypothetical protein HNQ08_000899 [Deinococcus humi]|uniref:Uncharacterized protein n=1 Tax=Deinococcus humi TaxID=662880 RepID=A0A7W8NC50_9DEIO|nr:hypothetical protein [Deinococcus humi]